MARPKGVKVSTLTPDNVQSLTICRDRGLLPRQVVITATTATWPLTFNAAGALQTVLDAIGQTDGTTRRALHAVRRKLEKQVRPDMKAVVPTPDPPKARKTKNTVACQAAGHGELVEVGPGRAKCMDCGLIVERPTGPVKATGRATRSRKLSEATQVPVPGARTKPQEVVQAAGRGVPITVVEFPGVSPGWHVVEFMPGRGGVGLVIATCKDEAQARRVAAALNGKAPQK